VGRETDICEKPKDLGDRWFKTGKLFEIDDLK
jgi:hypothetical protein